MSIALEEFPLVQKRFLVEYDNALGVLEFLRFTVRDADSSSQEIHRSVALTGLNEAVQAKNQEYGLAPGSHSHIPQEKFPLLEGERLTIEDFLGPRFDIKTRLLRDSAPIEGGFSYGFLSPPYGFKDAARARDLFFSVLKEVFKGPEESAAIFSWNTDFSRYFDEGREWWGTFFWTVEIPSESAIIVILGSATD